VAARAVAKGPSCRAPHGHDQTRVIFFPDLPQVSLFDLRPTQVDKKLKKLKKSKTHDDNEKK